MSRRGPKPKTDADRAPAPGPGLWAGFEPPADLDPDAAAEYARLVSALASVGTLPRTDPRIVVAAARTHSLLEAAHADVAAEGMTVASAQGTTLAHPLLAVINSLTMRLRGLWDDMGLTASSAKLGKPAADAAANPWAGLLNVVG